jgi:hypothetical protein
MHGGRLIVSAWLATINTLANKREEGYYPDGAQGVLGMSVITAGLCYQERNRAAMLPGLRAMLTEEENDNFLRTFLDLRR